MTEKLTLADCFKYPKSRLLYPISKVTHKDIESFFNAKLVYPQYTYLISDCKLILRDITQLTDEENIELKTLYDKAIIIAKDENTRSFESGKIIVDYLRSISVDIDGFLQSGKAVKG